MIFAVLDPSPLTLCINCSFFTFITYIAVVSVLTRNITFLNFAILVVRHSHCRPYKSF